MFRTQFHDIVYAQTSLFCVVLKYERRDVVASWRRALQMTSSESDSAFAVQKPDI